MEGKEDTGAPAPACVIAPVDGDRETQVFWVVRHGDRLDNDDPTWRKKAEHHEDTPLSPLGHTQAEEVAKYLLGGDHTVDHIVASPFLRAIQTSLPLSQHLQMKIKLESGVWETGCRRPPPPHQDKGFPLDPEYSTYFTPSCGERPKDFRPRLARAATGFLERFPFEAGNVAVFSHADPVAYLVSELTGVDPGLLGPVTVCCVFRLERRQGDARFTLTRNADIAHLSAFGNTEPCHPVHAFHDWCRLFGEMREQQVVGPEFRWPTTGDDMTKLKKCWEARYQGSLVAGQAPERPQSPHKVKFSCPRCEVVSYVSNDLYSSAPFTHSIKCWQCKVKFKLKEILQHNS